MKSHYYFTILAVLVLAAAQLASGTPLDDYIAAPAPTARCGTAAPG